MRNPMHYFEVVVVVVVGWRCAAAAAAGGGRRRRDTKQVALKMNSSEPPSSSWALFRQLSGNSASLDPSAAEDLLRSDSVDFKRLLAVFDYYENTSATLTASYSSPAQKDFIADISTLLGLGEVNGCIHVVPLYN